jgi:hypothetical protein
MRVVIMAVTLAMAAGTAFADEQTAAVQAAPKAKKEKVICKERVKANSRFTAKTCMTQAEWDATTETARSAFAEVQNRPMFDISRGN